MRRRGIRRKLLLKERRGYWKLKIETPDLTLWRTQFGSVCGRAGETSWWVGGAQIACKFGKIPFACPWELSRANKFFASSINYY
jgi:hypothetical protein